MAWDADDSNFDKNVTEASAELAKAKTIAPDRPETYYNEAILTQEYKAKSGGGKSNEPELLNAKKLFADFISKAGSAAEFADAVKRSKDRMGEIDQIIEFTKQSEKARKASEADAKTKAAEAEVKAEIPAGRFAEGEKRGRGEGAVSTAGPRSAADMPDQDNSSWASPGGGYLL